MKSRFEIYQMLLDLLKNFDQFVLVGLTLDLNIDVTLRNEHLITLHTTGGTSFSFRGILFATNGDPTTGFNGLFLRREKFSTVNFNAKFGNPFTANKKRGRRNSFS